MPRLPAQGKYIFLSGEAFFAGGRLLFSSKFNDKGYRFSNVPAHITECSASSVRYETKASKQEAAKVVIVQRLPHSRDGLDLVVIFRVKMPFHHFD